MNSLANRLSRVASRFGKCPVHGEPVWCVRCADLTRLSAAEAAALADLCRSVSEGFTPGPPQPPRCRGVRLCARCNGADCLTEAEQAYGAARLGGLTAQRWG